jgi:antitoxin ParD1/3/4/toxin ParE1/3/4
MQSLYSLSAEALDDLWEIWQRIASDSMDLANRIDDEFHDLFVCLAQQPGQGHSRPDLTDQAVLFFPLYSFLVVYRADISPIRIVAVLRGRRNVRQVLRQRP